MLARKYITTVSKILLKYEKYFSWKNVKTKAVRSFEKQTRSICVGRTNPNLGDNITCKQLEVTKSSKHAGWSC